MDNVHVKCPNNGTTPLSITFLRACNTFHFRNPNNSARWEENTSLATMLLNLLCCSILSVDLH